MGPAPPLIGAKAKKEKRETYMYLALSSKSLLWLSMNVAAIVLPFGIFNCAINSPIFEEEKSYTTLRNKRNRKGKKKERKREGKNRKGKRKKERKCKERKGDKCRRYRVAVWDVKPRYYSPIIEEEKSYTSFK
jgi:hypothetical protein